MHYNRYGNYHIVIHSNKSSRGVAIGYKTTVNIEILDQFRDYDQNILLLKTKLNDSFITLGSVYGPTQQDNPDFIDYLSQNINNLNCDKFIIGGDFNAVISDEDPANNQEVLYMRGIPNPVHSRKINQLINNEYCVDPFRSIYPTNKEYSYLPFNKEKLNLSRIDFFLTNKAQ